MIRREVFAKGAPLRPRALLRQTTLPDAPTTRTDTMKNIHSQTIIDLSMVSKKSDRNSTALLFSFPGFQYIRFVRGQS